MEGSVSEKGQRLVCEVNHTYLKLYVSHNKYPSNIHDLQIKGKCMLDQLALYD